MIQRKPVNRLGSNGPEEVKQHPWLKNFPWDKLLNKQLDAPFIPQVIYEEPTVAANSTTYNHSLCLPGDWG